MLGRGGGGWGGHTQEYSKTRSFQLPLLKRDQGRGAGEDTDVPLAHRGFYVSVTFPFPKHFLALFSFH